MKIGTRAFSRSLITNQHAKFEMANLIQQTKMKIWLDSDDNLYFGISKVTDYKSSLKIPKFKMAASMVDQNPKKCGFVTSNFENHRVYYIQLVFLILVHYIGTAIFIFRIFTINLHWVTRKTPQYLFPSAWSKFFRFIEPYWIRLIEFLNFLSKFVFSDFKRPSVHGDLSRPSDVLKTSMSVWLMAFGCFMSLGRL